MLDDAVPAQAVGAGLGRASFADDAESMRVVDVEQSVVGSSETRHRFDVGRVSGHAVDSVDADQARRIPVLLQEPLEIVQVVVAEALDRRAVRGCELSALVDRLVCAPVDVDRPVAGEHRNHRHVDQGDRRQHERVLGAEQRSQPLFDLAVEDRTAEQA